MFKKVDWTSKLLWVSLLSASSIILQALGIVKLPDNYEALINTVLSALVGLGILKNHDKVEE